MFSPREKDWKPDKERLAWGFQHLEMACQTYEYFGIWGPLKTIMILSYLLYGTIHRGHSLDLRVLWPPSSCPQFTQPPLMSSSIMSIFGAMPNPPSVRTRRTSYLNGLYRVKDLSWNQTSPTTLDVSGILKSLRWRPSQNASRHSFKFWKSCAIFFIFDGAFQLLLHLRSKCTGLG